MSEPARRANDARSDAAERSACGACTRRRLDVEAWRDAMLARQRQPRPRGGRPAADLDVAGQPPRHAVRQGEPARPGPCCGCSTSPTRTCTSEPRAETTVPQQQLFVLNSDVPGAAGDGLARAAKVRGGADPPSDGWRCRPR